MEQAISHTARLGKQHVHKLRRKASLVLIFTLQPYSGALAGVRVLLCLGLQEMKVQALLWQAAHHSAAPEVRSCPFPMKGWAFPFPTYLLLFHTLVTFAFLVSLWHLWLWIWDKPLYVLCSQFLHCRAQQREVAQVGTSGCCRGEGDPEPHQTGWRREGRLERDCRAARGSAGAVGCLPSSSTALSGWAPSRGGQAEDTQRLLQVCNALSLLMAAMCKMKLLKPFSLRIYGQRSSSLTHWNGWTALDETFNN